VQIDDEQKRMEKQVETRPRKSPRLKDKKGSGKSMVKLAQDLIAKECGILKDDEIMENLTL
jgi:hypothetical protein